MRKIELARADVLPLGDAADSDKDLEGLSLKLRAHSAHPVPDLGEAERRFNAMNAPSLPEQPLKQSERDLADKIIKDAQGHKNAFLQNDTAAEGQFNLDMAQTVSCLSRQQLAKLLPYINKTLEASGQRIANIPGASGDEVWLGTHNDSDGSFYVSDLIAKRLDYCGPTS